MDEHVAEKTIASSPIAGDDSVRLEHSLCASKSVPTALSLGLSNKYEILSVIGQGGMSVVYKARHRFSHQVLAIKMLKGHLSHDKVQLQRFIQEARAMEKLDHRNIVSARDVDYTGDGQPYLVMDFLEGTSLSERIKSSQPISVEKAMDFFLQACDALEHAHKNGVIHRDIKPSNIVILPQDGGEELVKIVDFGIAKLMQENDSAAPGLTQTGEVFGSPYYMSPEQCTGNQLDARSDIYSFGCVMYETLVGRAPFQGNSPLEIIRMHVDEMAAPLEVANCAPGLVKSLDRIIFKAMEKDPARRYQSMSALKKDLLEASEASELSTHAGAGYIGIARLLRQFSKTIVRHPIKFAGVVASVVALTCFALYAYSLVVPLTELPKTIASHDWVWDQPDVKPRPPTYGNTARKAIFLFQESQNRSNINLKKTLQGHKLLSGFFFQHGDWAQARDHLKEMVIILENDPDYGPTSMDAIDANQSYGLCLYRLKEYSEAARSFSTAISRLEEARKLQGQIVGNLFSPMLDVRYANTLRLTGEISTASFWYKRALSELYSLRRGGRGVSDLKPVDATMVSAAALSPRASIEERLLDAMARAGLADCDVLFAQRNNSELDFTRAVAEYEAAQALWKSVSTSNPDIAQNVENAQVGIVNAAILGKNYKMAAAEIDELLSTPGGRKVLEDPLFRQNYARVLWSAGDYVKAVRIAIASKLL